MTWPDDGRSHNGEPKKSELLPRGDKAKEIVEVLAAIYRAMHSAEGATNDNETSEDANQRRTAGTKKEGQT